MLRRPFIFSLVLSLTLFLSFSPDALAGDQRWLGLSPNDRVIVDRIAADFYQVAVQRSQSRAIEAQTSQTYSNGAPVDQARFRAQRRNDWRGMSNQQRAALRNAKTPHWQNLTALQKAPFRQQAMDFLGAGVAPHRQPTPRGRNI